MAVADRREGLYAEEERAQPVAAHVVLALPAQTRNTTEQVRPREQRVEREVRTGHHRKEAWPADGEQRMVPVQIRERGETHALRGERPVAVQQTALPGA